MLEFSYKDVGRLVYVDARPGLVLEPIGALHAYVFMDGKPQLVSVTVAKKTDEWFGEVLKEWPTA